MEKLPDSPPGRTAFRLGKNGDYHHTVTMADLYSVIKPCCDNCIHYAGEGKSRVYCTPCQGGPPIWHHESDVAAADLHLSHFTLKGVRTGRFSTTEPNFSDKPEHKSKNPG